MSKEKTTIEKVADLFRYADPQQNPRWQERRNALNLAHNAAYKYGIDWAALISGGYFDAGAAERIENQFAVGSVGNTAQQETPPADGWTKQVWEAFRRHWQDNAKRAAEEKTYKNNGMHFNAKTGGMEYSGAGVDWSKTMEAIIADATDANGCAPLNDGY